MRRTTDRAARGGLLPLVLTMVMLPVLLGLGTWQVFRLDWKLDLLQRIDDRVQSAPEPLPATITVPEDWDYRPVILEGELLHDSELRLLSQFDDGSVGVHLIVPLVRSADPDAPPVLIDRGWVPEAPSDTDVRRPAAPTVISGIARLPDPQGLFVPANDPAAGDWYWRDLPAMGRVAGFDAVAPLIVEAARSDDGSLPLGHHAQVTIPNNHLKYALTWYALAVALLVVYVAYRRRSRRDAGEQA